VGSPVLAAGAQLAGPPLDGLFLVPLPTPQAIDVMAARHVTIATLHVG